MNTSHDLRWLITSFLPIVLIGVASASTCVQPPAGLRHWWPAEGTAEEIVNGHDGSLQGGATFSVGAVGQAFLFDGVDDSVLTDVVLPSVGSVEFWVKPTSLEAPGSTQILLGTHGVANGNDRLWIVSSGPAGGPGVQPNTLVVNLGSCCVNDLVVANPLSPGLWTHLALTFDYTADVYTLSVNGVLMASSTAPRHAPTQGLRLGGATSNFGQNFFFHGSVDEVSIYDRVLSPSDIGAIVAAGSQGKCLAASRCLGSGDAFLGGFIKKTAGGLVPGVTVTVQGPACQETLTTATGLYLLPYIGDGAYTVSPTKDGCVFLPPVWTGTLVKRWTFVPFAVVCP